MIRFLILAVFIPASLATTGITTCSGSGAPAQGADQVTVHGCDAAPCDILLGEEALMNVIFTAPHDIERFTPHTVAFLGPLPVPYPLPPEVQNYACENLVGAECPIPAGTVVNYLFRLAVSNNYPVLSNLGIELTLTDQSGQGIICTRIPINSVDPTL
ncbi:NPC intracellular cholesterol transporter 2-like [Phlebotomus argentipes]|uniref:NPC intracellular cholesterol transporter 2-like n=1 Tax=Phlebotomus argentipes TaxID=94469 RepID=UPI002892D313|nr:NPC intracellular cholesterol transporter 2-like [Phlebotomus argentipes]